MNYKDGYDFVYNDSDPIDYNGHGTHVAGIIAAKNNGVGVVGVAPNSSIYAVSVLSPYGDGLTSWIISGIEWAVEKNMTIASMSFTCNPNPYYECDDPALHAALDNAYNSGLLLVASGGNTNGGEVRYPAAYDSVIAVTATDQNDNYTSFDPTGPKIELAAPGVNVLSTVPTGTCVMCDPSGYKYASGTSMAAPHVAGVAALILSSNFRDANGDGVKNNSDVRMLLHNAKDLGIPGRDATYGYGLVDASMAVLGISGYTDIDLTLKVTKKPGDTDSQKVSLTQGYYSITIHNTNLSKVYMEIYENDKIRKDLSSRFNFNHTDEINFNLKVYSSVFDIVFKPYGSPGSTGNVTIKRLS
jgi:subtilisin